MNTAQRQRIIDKIAGLAYDTRRAAYFAWLDIRSTSSGKVSAGVIPPAALAQGDGVFWTWNTLEDRVFIKSPVAVLDALEAIDALRPLPFTGENGDC